MLVDELEGGLLDEAPYGLGIVKDSVSRDEVILSLQYRALESEEIRCMNFLNRASCEVQSRHADEE